MTSSKALTSPEQPSVYLNRAGLYQQLLAHRGVVPSISRKGNCYDTAPVESFFSSLKNELVRHRRFAHQAEARYAIAEYI